VRSRFQLIPIPIIAGVDDIVGSGLISSLAKPGGNTTGASILATDLDGKRLDILRHMVISARRFAVLSDPSNAQATPRQLVHTTRALGLS
jgi:putative ABC transport system substrate-binding protein